MLINILVSLQKQYPLFSFIMVAVFASDIVKIHQTSYLLILLILIYLVILFIRRLVSLWLVLILFIFTGLQVVSLNSQLETEERIVSGDLVWLQSVPKITKDYQYFFEIKSSSKRYYCKTLALLSKNFQQLQLGDYFYVRVRYLPFDFSNSYHQNLYVRNYQGVCEIEQASLAVKSDYGWLSSVRLKLIDHLLAKYKHYPGLSDFMAMTIGFDNLLSSQERLSYRHLGLTHLQVVSGFQLTLIFYFIFTLLSKLLAYIQFQLNFRFKAREISMLIAFLFSLLYALIIGLDASIFRALIAETLLILNYFLKRKVSFVNIILATLYIDLILNPLTYLGIGTQLTYAALAGIAFSTSSLFQTKINFITKIKQLVKCNFWIFICTGIFLILHFDELSILSVPANLLFATLISFLSCSLGFIAIILSCLGSDFLIIFLLDQLNNLSQLISWIDRSFYFNLSCGFTFSCLLVVLILKIFYRWLNPIYRFRTRQIIF